MIRSAIPASVDARGKESIKTLLRASEGLSRRELEERNRTLMAHFPQVRNIARRIHDRLPQQVPLEDLVQSGVVGLIEALHKFDPTRNVQLKSYAKMRIQGAIVDSLRELDWSPRTLRKKARQLEQGDQTLRARLGRTPTDTELAAAVGISLNALQHLLGEIRGLELGSLQALNPGNNCNYDSSSYLPCSPEQDPPNLCLRSEMNALLARAMRELPPRKRRVLALYYFEELTMKEVGAMLGVGESRVSQIHTAAMARLRVRMRQLLEPRRHPSPPPEHETREESWESAVPGICSEPAPRFARVRAMEHCGWAEVPAGLHLQFLLRQSSPQGAGSVYHYALPQTHARVRSSATGIRRGRAPSIARVGRGRRPTTRSPIVPFVPGNESA